MTMLPISDRRYRNFFILSAQFDNNKSSRSMTELTESLTPSPAPPPSKQAPFREDCWTEDATWTLVDAWGRRYLDLNRGNLRQKDWQEVANAVNALHGHTKKTRRSDVQCKNRIDTLKKKYKVEKMRISECDGVLTSNWPFFSRFEHLIGSKFSENFSSKLSPSPNLALPSPPPPPIALPLAHRKLSLIGSNVFTPPILPQKRQMPSPPEDNDVSHFRRNYSAMAAAAAAEDENDGESGGDDDKEEEEGEEGMSRLARAIESFGEIYERVESMKQRQMVELEKQRMQFAKDLEVQRMQLFMDTQLQLEKIKRAKRSGSSDDIYS